ncbi:MAG: hypothetical protein DRJ47_10165 [Thermoprotei archaeon]|nr:MAG: hypothetical protein DRJ47_10165 [Thermoprotei archaeon]
MMDEYGLCIPVGKTPEAVLSVILALLEKYDIRKVTLLPSKETLRYAGLVSKILLKELNVQVDIVCVPENSIEGICSTCRKILREYEVLGLKTIVDVTPGRKTMSISLYTAALEHGADKVTYLHLLDERYRGVLYPLIPKPLRKLIILYQRR